MQNYKIHGLSEIMLFHCDMDKKELFQTDRRDYSDFIDEKLLNESSQVFVLGESYSDNELVVDFKIGDGNEINCKIEYSEENQLPAIEENKIRLVCWEMLEETNASIDIPEGISELNLKIKGNTYGCMDEWGNKAFENYSFIAGNEDQELYFESESFGDIKEKVFYFIDFNGNCEEMRGKVSAKEYYEILRRLGAIF
ncbi:hypothetical protein [Candidatus Thioglobus sp. NP1]|uniref:hypothetical protein n=1 Tax=Candidatus Thioglobus sp. NP1 TaxID=2508687 RepID=UPI000DED535F|nr:hypothetical protein [Candidatus Thioglobus sp. NP1]AXE61918.1 hypothetical protein CRN91_04455 [Candidatus Thioglobus sp. NP1]